MKRKSKAPIFICGEGRSGTKLLRDVLAKHQSLYNFRCESYLFVDSGLQNIRYKDKYKQNNFEKLKVILTCLLSKNKNIAEKNLKFGDFSEELLDLAKEISGSIESEDLSFYSLFDIAADYLTKKQGKERWIEKTPFHVYYSDEILQFFPDARIIVNYRDPRAVVASWLKKDSNKTLISIVQAWNRVTSQILKLKAVEKNKDSFYFMSYEDLITDPKSELEKICDFIGEDFDDSLLDIEVVNSLFEDKGKKGFLTNAIDRWKKVLTDEQIEIIDILTASNRLALGYEDKGRGLTLKSFLVFLYELLLFPVMKLKKFLNWI